MIQRLLLAFGGLILISGFGVLTLNTQPVVADTVSDIKQGVTGSGGGGASNSGGRIPVVVKTAVNILLFVIGIFAVIMIVVAGLRFITANGDSNTISSARNTILYSLVGIAIAFMAFAIVNFIVDQL